MKVEVSLGEAIDKYSILEIKLKNIFDQSKQIEIQKELDALNECKQYITEYAFFYKLLMFVNQKIWDMTNIIKTITIENAEFAQLSNQIFEFNQKRYRLKNVFNLLSNSELKEQKSYNASYCKIIVNDIETIYDKISEINYLSIEYDYIIFDQEYIEKIKEIFISPNIIINHEIINNTTIQLHDFSIDNNLQNIFGFDPITYLCGGKMGDYIQSLSVINETFYKTGKKGIIYLSNCGDVFSTGLQQTYNDTYDLIMTQRYIKEYNIYNNEPTCIDLTSWRNSHLLYKASWYHIYKNHYEIEWGTHKWINTQSDDKWKDKVIMNIMHYRNNKNLDYQKLYNLYGSSLIFMSFDKKDYNIFIDKTKLNIEYYCPTSFTDACIVINSCKLLVANLSGLLTIGHSMHKCRLIGLMNEHDDTHNINFKNIWQNVSYSV